MNKILRLALAMASACVIAAAAAEKGADVEKKASETKQTLCPVMGGPVKPNIYADYQGYRIYFCCSGCIASFKKDPEKYVEKLKKEGVTLEKAPAK